MKRLAYSDGEMKFGLFQFSDYTIFASDVKLGCSSSSCSPGYVRFDGLSGGLRYAGRNVACLHIPKFFARLDNSSRLRVH